ncbi:hypothetical protein ES703_94891 [subsurface metagenome]
MDKRKQIAILIGVVVSLLAATAVGIVIMSLRSHWSEAIDPKLQVQRQETKPAAEVKAEDENLTNITEEDEEFLRWVYENTAEEEQAEAEVEEDVSQPEEPVAAVVEEEGAPLEQQGRRAQGPGGWRNVWADLNLTQEQQERLGEAMRLAMDKWQNMTDEERQDEMEKMREGWEKWQNMSDEEREDAMEQMREKFEDWLDSDEVELPDFSLD